MISVVIPVYNHDVYLADAIHSCLLCGEVTEILIADDGSTDRSREIIEFFAASFPDKIRDLTDKPAVNIGAHNRINRLCAQARNEWIAILNSDDRFEPGRFRNFELFARYTAADLIFGNCAIVGPADELLGYKYGLYTPEYALPDKLDVNHIFKKEHWLLALLNQNFIATTSNILFKKKLFEDLKGFAPYRYIHDWDFLIRAASSHKVAYNPNMWTDYRIHPSNTISESSFKVRAEVKEMMADLLGRPGMSRHLAAAYGSEQIAAALKGNRYLSNSKAITFVFSEPYHRKAVQLTSHFPGATIVQNPEEAVGTALYVYAPTELDDMLTPNDLLNLLTASVLGNLDVCLCALAFGAENEFLGNVRDVSLWRPNVLKEFITGRPLRGRRGKVISVPRLPHVANRTVESAFADQAMTRQGRNFTFHGATSENIFPHALTDLPAKELINTDDERPVVFVFPAVLAVGGAENVLIEVMKQLRHKYRFIIICTEALAESQGSSVARALEHAESYFDLTQLGSGSDSLNILAWLKATYVPKLLFITNGSIWQVQHSWQLRKMFRDVPIVDHQAYDAQFGWVEWLKYPNLRAADRYVAVTRKIEQHFLDVLSLEKQKVDFIPHPINSERISHNLPTFDRSDALSKFGLSSDLPVVAFVGRMVPQKRPWLYVDLAARAKRDGLAVQFAMVGQGDLSESIETRIEAEGLDNIIRVANANPLEELYFVTDLLVITSEYEGVPLAMLEAMSTGVPVLAMDVGDIGDVLGKYHDQKVHPVDTDIDNFYDHFVSAIQNLGALKQTALAASGGVLHDYSGANIARMYEDSFESARSRYGVSRAY